MRRFLTTVAVFTIAATVMLALAVSASAHSDKRFVLTTRLTLTGDTTATGTFAAGGAINDRGTFDLTFTATPTRDDCFVVSSDWTFTGSAGTLTIHGSGSSCSSSPLDPRAIFDSRFKITSGSGAYARLSGEGTIIGLADFDAGTATDVFDGKARLGR